jgi:hypothetical protein
VEAANALKVESGDTLQLDFLASPLQVLTISVKQQKISRRIKVYFPQLIL